MNSARRRRTRHANVAFPTLEGRVRGIAHGGEAVVETERGLVFVPFGLPGERVTLKGVERSGSVLRGRIAAIEEPSADRVHPPCEVLARCGGCLLMPLALPAQRAHKRSLVASALERAFPGLGLEVVLETAGDDLGYRRRARLHWEAGSNRRLGFRSHRSREIVEPSRCLVLAPAIDAGRAAFLETLLPKLRGRGEVWLALGEAGRTVLAVMTPDPQGPEAYEAAERLAGQTAIAGVALRVGGASSDATWGDPREWIEGSDGLPLLSAAGGFSQANDAVSRILVTRAVHLAEARDASVLELYAGHGNFTVALARDARELLAVELDEGAARSCRDNLAARGLPGTVVTGDASGALPRKRVDVVLLDPPRTGAKDALADVVRLRPRRIVYVSCDPSTLERDLRVLGAHGYVPDAAFAFDMFPQTAHVEALVRLVPRLAHGTSER